MQAGQEEVQKIIEASLSELYMKLKKHINIKCDELH
jgi:hypothetical protein